ncbi:MAG: response regulator transcription factor [Actinomycetota bacterium]|nr:response regulator transcription factor [Actinomycetota bacterium]
MPNRTPTTIVTTDPVLRSGLQYALRAQPEILIVETDGWLEDHLVAPHVAVVAEDHLDKDTLQVIRSHARQENRKVAGVITNLETRSVFAGLEAGLSIFIRRSEASARVLVDGIVGAASGERSVPKEMLPDVLGSVGRIQREMLAPRGLSLAPLTERETAVLRLLANGCAIAEISRTLAYSERTVKNVVHDVTIRLGLRNRTHAVAYAVREGLI